MSTVLKDWEIKHALTALRYAPLTFVSFSEITGLSLTDGISLLNRLQSEGLVVFETSGKLNYDFEVTPLAQMIVTLIRAEIRDWAKR